jgi:glucose-6-phosphate 1-epimerase
VAGALTFDSYRGLTRLNLTLPAVHATMYLQGAHLTHWQPACQDPVLFLSRKSEFAPGQPIRGGIPVAFPWFATDSKRDRIDGHPGPLHGFARLQEWTLMEAKPVAKGFHLKLTLGPTEMSRAMGFDRFLLTYDVELGAHLTCQLTVSNPGSSPLSFEEALHNYFSVVDVHESTVAGLEDAPYIDKVDEMKEKPSTGRPIAFTGPTDRVYLNTTTPSIIRDGTQRRDIHIVKTNSRNTVVWNPGKALADVGEWDWHEMLCVETANVGVNQRTLAPGETFTMGQTISVKKWTAGQGCSTTPERSPHGTE